MLITSKIIFPMPSPSYTTELPNLFWLPRNLERLHNEETELMTDSIPCLYVTSEHSKVWVIYSHGNACDIGHMLKDCQSYAKFWRVNVVAYEYKGYGVAKGTPKPKNIKNDITTVFQFLTTFLNVPTKNIILFGRSIGTGPSCYLAKKIEEQTPNSLGCLILQSPYTTIRDVATFYVPGLGNAIPKCFDNIKNITFVKAPLILIHGKKDEVIPFEMSQELFEVSTSEFKRFQECPDATHNCWRPKRDVIYPTREFLQKVHEPDLYE